MRASYIAYLKEAAHADSPLLPVFLFGLLVAVVCGLFNGTLVSVIGIQPIVATLILMIAGRGIAQDARASRGDDCVVGEERVKGGHGRGC